MISLAREEQNERLYPKIVRSYMTGRTITPDYVKRIKVETIVSDSAVNQILDDISNKQS